MQRWNSSDRESVYKNEDNMKMDPKEMVRGHVIRIELAY
jgi:hypothetical protein